MRYCIDFQ